MVNGSTVGGKKTSTSKRCRHEGFRFTFAGVSCYYGLMAIKSFLIACAILGEACAKGAETRPNILFCLADDWVWPHAGVYGDRAARTPTFDRVAREGMLFNYCFSASPSWLTC